MASNLPKTHDLVIESAHVVAPDPQTGSLRSAVLNVGIKNGKIATITSSILSGKSKITAKGLHLLPGAIDTQVHFRDPGFPEKEDFASGTRAAIYGGVTSVFDMPNTKPPTLTALDIADKLNRAKEKSWCHYAFYVGASPANVDRLADLERLPGVCGVKMFMGSSTGNLIVGGDDVIRRALQNGSRRMAVHSEDEDRLNERKKIVTENPGHVELHPVWRDEETAVLSTKKIIAMAKEYNRKIHVLHVTTAEEIDLLARFKNEEWISEDNAKNNGPKLHGLVTFEITPQHLTLSAPECYERLGTLAQMNPPIRDERHQKALWSAINNGLVDVIGSDHAPHTLAEKQKTYPDSPSGMTGVQTLLPLMLDHVNRGRLSLFRLIELVAHNPARLFGIQNKGEIRVGYDADLVLVDLKANREIQNSWIQSRCGWTPYAGMKISAWITATLINGQVIMRDDQIVGPLRGQPLNFIST